MSISSSNISKESEIGSRPSLRQAGQLVFQTQSTQSSWYCHCCTAKNVSNVQNCRVCGKHESYALSGYHLPFHGQTGKLYRPSQVINVLEDIHETDSEKWTALHSACANGNTPIVRQLLEYKSHIEAITDKGHRPIHLAVYSGNFDCVYELVKRGADVNSITFEELTTPLHMACEKGYAKIAQLLLQNGANLHALNILQRTPLHCTAISGRTDIALLLLRSGASLHPLDIHGWEPCQIAELNHHRDLQELFIREGMVDAKQVVIKELPPAKWHNEVWFEVVKMHSQRKDDNDKLKQYNEKEERKLKEFQEELQENSKLLKAQQNKEIRQKELEEYQKQLDKRKNNNYNLQWYAANKKNRLEKDTLRIEAAPKTDKEFT
jgi:ankyrin repeat protein